MDDVEMDFKNMGLKIWETKALDRAECAFFVRETKAELKGPWC
jgi:hypothetical protein